MRQEVRVGVVRLFYILFFLFLVNRIFFFSIGVTEKTFSYFLYPFLKIHKNIIESINQKAERRHDVQALQQELDGLYVQHDVLKGRIAQLQAQQAFIDQSAEVVNFAKRYDAQNKKLAKILLVATNSFEDIMFVDGGKNVNIHKDDVVVYQNALIGRVIEVLPWYSKVALITDQRCKISAQACYDEALLGTNEQDHVAQGICCGKNNNQLEFCFVPHFKKVVEGDLVISTGQGLLYPQGFVLGIIQKIKTDLVSHYIQLRPYVDVNKISYVYIFVQEQEVAELTASGS